MKRVFDVGDGLCRANVKLGETWSWRPQGHTGARVGACFISLGARGSGFGRYGHLHALEIAILRNTISFFPGQSHCIYRLLPGASPTTGWVPKPATYKRNDLYSKG